MRKDIVQCAKILAEFIEKQDGKIVTITNKDIHEICDPTISTNSMVIIRRCIPFVSETPIIQIRDRYRRKTSFFVISKEEFENYQFNEENFSALIAKDIDNIILRVHEAGKDVRNINVYRALVLCDIILQVNGRDRYKTIRHRVLSLSLNLDQTDLAKLIAFMKYAGIIDNNLDLFRYNTVFRDLSGEPHDGDDQKGIQAKHVAVEQAFNQSGDAAKSQQILDNIQDHLNEIRVLVGREKAMQENFSKENDELKVQVAALRKELNKAKRKTDAYTAFLTEYKNLTNENAQLKKQADEYADTLKSYKAFRKTVEKKTESVMADFTQKMLSYVAEYQADHKDSQFTFRVNALTADAMKGLMNAISLQSQS